MDRRIREYYSCTDAPRTGREERLIVNARHPLKICRRPRGGPKTISAPRHGRGGRAKEVVHAAPPIRCVAPPMSVRARARVADGRRGVRRYAAPPRVRRRDGDGTRERGRQHDNMYNEYNNIIVLRIGRSSAPRRVGAGVPRSGWLLEDARPRYSGAVAVP